VPCLVREGSALIQVAPVTESALFQEGEDAAQHRGKQEWPFAGVSGCGLLFTHLMAVRPRDEYSLISHLNGVNKMIGAMDDNVGTLVVAAWANRPT
jgi:hypothetical protein